MSTRPLRFVSKQRPPRGFPTIELTDFYREEFLKHQQFFRAQREHFSETAVASAETALRRVMAHLGELCARQNADQVVSQLLSTFDSVTRLSALSDPKKVH
jgi:uncharacterized protein YcaQ